MITALGNCDSHLTLEVSSYILFSNLSDLPSWFSWNLVLRLLCLFPPAFTPNLGLKKKFSKYVFRPSYVVSTVLGAGDVVPSLKAFFLSAVMPDFDCLSHCISQLTNKFQENFISTILLPSFQNFRPVLELSHIKWHFQFHSYISSDGNQSMLELWKSGLFSHMFSSDMMCYDILHGLIGIRVN